MDRHIAKVWSLEFPSPTHKFVALCLARMSIRGGLCWAKQKTIAADTQFHVKTVGKVLAELEDMGWIKRQGFLKRNGQRGADHIWLTLPEVVLEADEAGDDSPFGSDEENGGGSPPLRPGSAALPTRKPTTPHEGVDVRSKSQGTLGESEGEDGRETPELSEADSQAIDLDAAVAVIWAGVGERGRKRSAKAKVKKALSAALARRPRGVSLDDHLKRILQGVRAYLADPDTRKDGGKFEHGAHRTLENDVWETFLGDSAGRIAAGERQPADPDLGSADAPGPQLQRYWMDTERQGLPWHAERGPRPGMPGCRVDPALQREFGFTPWEGPADDDASAFL